MPADLWVFAVLCAATLGYLLHTMGRISADTRAIAQMLREMRDR